jgi:predicted nucleotidyltransferase component of viral defense system
VIRKQDILDRAAEWGLRPGVVEKDYVLGWLLAGFAANAVASSSWVFKGGTCLKKCFFETYRFSEDLDFSLTPDAPYDEAAVRAVMEAVAAYAAEMSGISLPVERMELTARHDKQGRSTYQGKLSYQGPLAVPTWPRILLDITQHEAVVAPPSRRPTFHPYPDGLPEGAGVLCYSLEELFAEKTRALHERTRPRDLYDVVHLSERRNEVTLDSVREVLTEKCVSKGVIPPTSASLIALATGSEELKADWNHMLAHQLPSVPALDGLLARLDEVLDWIDAPRSAPTPLRELTVKPGETRVRPRGGQYWGGGQKLEVVRFAGANRLKVAFRYHSKLRIAEPYSFRRKSNGNLLLYAWEDGAPSIKAFITTEMYDVEVTNQPFQPKYRVEFTG